MNYWSAFIIKLQFSFHPIVLALSQWKCGHFKLGLMLFFINPSLWAKFQLINDPFKGFGYNQVTGPKWWISHSLLMLPNCGIHLYLIHSPVHLHHHLHSIVVSWHICTREGFGSERLFFWWPLPSLLLAPSPSFLSSFFSHTLFCFSFSLLFFYVKYSFFSCSYEANCLRALYKFASL